MRRILTNWPRLVFLYLPLLIIAIDAAVLVFEQHKMDEEKAIRLVRESTSRKQGFTVQQLLYATVYHRKKSGGAMNVEGWHAERSEQSDSSFVVRFSFADPTSRHVALWSVDLEKGSIAPQDEMATDLSWR